MVLAAQERDLVPVGLADSAVREGVQVGSAALAAREQDSEPVGSAVPVARERGSVPGDSAALAVRDVVPAGLAVRVAQAAIALRPPVAVNSTASWDCPPTEDCTV